MSGQHIAHLVPEGSGWLVRFESTTEIPLSRTLARGRNGWFGARWAVVFGTERVTRATDRRAPPPRTLPDPGVRIKIHSIQLAKTAPIWLDLTREDAVAFASAILVHAHASPAVLIPLENGVPAVRARRMRVKASGEVVDVLDFGPRLSPRWWGSTRGYTDEEIELGPDPSSDAEPTDCGAA